MENKHVFFLITFFCLFLYFFYLQTEQKIHDEEVCFCVKIVQNIFDLKTKKVKHKKFWHFCYCWLVLLSVYDS